MSAITGTAALASANRCSGSRIARRPATAHRWMIAFVDPPMAARAAIALLKPAPVSTAEGRCPAAAMATIRRPAASALAVSRGSPVAATAVPGSIMPSVSAMIAMVDAVPIVLQGPRPCPRHVSSRAQSASPSRPARRSSS